MAGLLVGGIFLLNRADAQARDTIRKHHLEDIEQSLYFAQSLHGTYPPYDDPFWCGSLNAPENTSVRSQIEVVLRQQNEKYGNEAKPFPTDPNAGTGEAVWDYFYWKRSPATFELYAVLETDDNNERTSIGCEGAPVLQFDYGLNSSNRRQP